MRKIGGTQNRLDGTMDGAWSVCFDQGLLQKDSCIVYSFGVGGDWSFDELMATGDAFGLKGPLRRGVGCAVHSFDPSMGTPAHVHQPGTVWFMPTALGAADELASAPTDPAVGWPNGRSQSMRSLPWRMATLSSIMRQLGHSRVSLVKIDVESYEWGALTTALASGALDGVDQLLFEAHLVVRSSAGLVGGGVPAFLKVLSSLRNASFELFASVPNLIANFTRLEPGADAIPSCWELSFVRTLPPPGSAPYGWPNGWGRIARLPPEVAPPLPRLETDLCRFFRAAGLQRWQCMPWPRRRPIRAAAHERCEAKSVAAYEGTGVRAYTQCVRPYPDKLSDAVKASGRWRDCDALLRLWRMATYRTPFAGRSNVPPHKSGRGATAATSPIFVDAGANIGSCTLLMLAAGAPTVAFEPLAANLHYLTSSVLHNDFGAKLHLFPLALGESPRLATIHSSPANAGNTVIDRAVGDDAEDERAMRAAGPAQRVGVLTLDSVLWPNPISDPPPDIALMKIDVQGFECQLLRGAQALLAAGAIRTIKFEVATRWLHAQNASAVALFEQLTSYGFSVHDNPDDGHLGAAVSLSTFESLDMKPFAIADFVAFAPREGGGDGRGGGRRGTRARRRLGKQAGKDRGSHGKLSFKQELGSLHGG